MLYSVAYCIGKVYSLAKTGGILVGWGGFSFSKKCLASEQEKEMELPLIVDLLLDCKLMPFMSIGACTCTW